MSAKRAQLSKTAMQRWDAMFEAQRVRMERQRDALGRMATMMTEAVAALTQIAEMQPVDNEEGNLTEAQDRAKEALALIEEMRLRHEAAADHSDGEG